MSNRKHSAWLLHLLTKDDHLYVELGVLGCGNVNKIWKARKDLQFVLVDTWKLAYFDRTPTKKARLEQKAQQWAAKRKGTRIFNENSWEAARHFKDGEVDVVFIDADHTYECCSLDILRWRPKLRSGGLLCGHDFHTRPGVARAVKEHVPDYQHDPSGDVWWVRV